MHIKRLTRRTLTLSMGALGLALFVGYQVAQAQRKIPTEHQGVKVVSLGVLPESSLAAQIGLRGYVMQLREITLAPGGRIGRHDHFRRPGLVATLSGTWTEGRPSGEKEYPASKKQAILEDQDTEHWFWNDGAEPVTVTVCDLVPAK